MLTKKLTSSIRFLGLLGLLYLTGQAMGVCNVCQTNKVACINSTSFYLCFGDGTPHTNQLYHCLEGFDCTNLTAICAQKSSQRPPSCGDTAQCGLCSAQRNYLFACLSRGIFQMCYGANWPSGSYGYCPTGYVCDAGTDSVCVPEVEGQTYTCDVNDALVDTTTTTTTTTSTASTDINTDSSSSSSEATTPESSSTSSPWTALEVCEEEKQTGLFNTVPTDPYCQRYIYCYYKNGVVKAAEYNCTANSYFNAEDQVCSYIKSDDCL